MNIYFSCSITGGRRDQAEYRAIVNALLAGGHEVPTAILAEEHVVGLDEMEKPEDVYTRDIAWLDGCDAVVAEISTPSHGVGYEIAYALAAGKPVLCGYKRGVKVSKMLTGNHQPGFRVESYEDVADFIREIDDFLGVNFPGR